MFCEDSKSCNCFHFYRKFKEKHNKSGKHFFQQIMCCRAYLETLPKALNYINCKMATVNLVLSPHSFTIARIFLLKVHTLLLSICCSNYCLFLTNNLRFSQVGFAIL